MLKDDDRKVASRATSSAVQRSASLPKEAQLQPHTRHPASAYVTNQQSFSVLVMDSERTGNFSLADLTQEMKTRTMEHGQIRACPHRSSGKIGAGRGNRTPKGRSPADFESATSASSVIPAGGDTLRLGKAPGKLLSDALLRPAAALTIQPSRFP